MMIRWQEIRQQYEEQGASLRALAAKHDVPRTTLIRRRDAEQWTRNGPLVVHGPGETDRAPRVSNQVVALSDDAVAIARLGLRQLAMHLQQDGLLSIQAHKSLSDALSSYVKVLIMAPRETEAPDVLSVPLNKLSPRTRLAIQRLLDEDEAQERATL